MPVWMNNGVPFRKEAHAQFRDHALRRRCLTDSAQLRESGLLLSTIAQTQQQAMLASFFFDALLHVERLAVFGVAMLGFSALRFHKRLD